MCKTQSTDYYSDHIENVMYQTLRVIFEKEWIKPEHINTTDRAKKLLKFALNHESIRSLPALTPSFCDYVQLLLETPWPDDIMAVVNGDRHDVTKEGEENLSNFLEQLKKVF